MLNCIVQLKCHTMLFLFDNSLHSDLIMTKTKYFKEKNIKNFQCNISNLFSLTWWLKINETKTEIKIPKNYTKQKK